MLSLKPSAARFLDKKNPCFKQLHGTLDNLFHRLHEEGAGRVKHAEVITVEENVLWASGELGIKNPDLYKMLYFITMERTFV